MVEVRLISFNRHKDELNYIYGLSTREPKEGDYIYCRDYGKFMCIQYVGKGMLSGKHENWHKIEITNNPDLKLPQLPQSVIDAYVKEGIKKITIRL